jgi:predicted enzyme related to lactoylglutathione lyase
MDKVVHFEIPYGKKDRAVNFYTRIFGWKTIDIPDMEYTMVWAAKTDKRHMVTEKGCINGGMFRRSKEAKTPVVVIGVRDVKETIKKVKAAGGKVVTPVQMIPNGRYARVADCEGNVIGLADSKTK